jgi:hypothetical protein
MADDQDVFRVRCTVEFRRRDGDPPAIVQARRWFKLSLRGFGGRMLSATRVEPEVPAAAAGLAQDTAGASGVRDGPG